MVKRDRIDKLELMNKMNSMRFGISYSPITLIVRMVEWSGHLEPRVSFLGRTSTQMLILSLSAMCVRLKSLRKFCETRIKFDGGRFFIKNTLPTCYM